MCQFDNHETSIIIILLCRYTRLIAGFEDNKILLARSIARLHVQTSTHKA